MSDIGNVINDIPTIAQTESLPNLHSYRNSQNSFMNANLENFENLEIHDNQIYNSNEYKQINNSELKRSVMDENEAKLLDNEVNLIESSNEHEETSLLLLEKSNSGNKIKNEHDYTNLDDTAEILKINLDN